MFLMNERRFTMVLLKFVQTFSKNSERCKVDYKEMKKDCFNK